MQAEEGPQGSGGGRSEPPSDPDPSQDDEGRARTWGVCQPGSGGGGCDGGGSGGCWRAWQQWHESSPSPSLSWHGEVEGGDELP